MAGRALNDEEVATEMKKMVQFIKQEANEKAREIQVKADEEHNIEKAKLVRQETIAIDAVFLKKAKQFEIQRKIAQSNLINKSRLKVLQAREESLSELLVQSRKSLQAVASDTNQYKRLLKDLMLQGMFQLLEDEITIVCKKNDVQLVESVLGEAKQDYQAKMKKEIKIIMDKDQFLPDTIAGGVILSSNHGRIQCDNTLEARLDLAFEKVGVQTVVSHQGV